MMIRPCLVVALVLFITGPAAAQMRQTEADTYTRYELLAPATHSFRIVYEVTATTPGATTYFNPIRPGSTASDERVSDRATGKPLNFKEVGGDVARAGGIPDATPEARFIAVTLARPVPADGGEARILIDKTYADAKSYFSDGETVVFDRSLGIKRNAIVLPLGYRLVSCNVPSQVLQETDGRLKISFWNAGAGPAPLHLVARPGGPPAGASSLADKLGERAYQDREIVYYLRQPETHAFDLAHDYTETRPGTSSYVNVVRTGSTVADPSARNLDTGAALTVEKKPGEVVFRFPPVVAGQSLRLRIAETYTDPERYLVVGDELVWHRSFGRPANAVVLPSGWALTNSSIPAAVSTTPDGRVRLDFINPRSDEIDVMITARRAG